MEVPFTGLYLLHDRGETPNEGLDKLENIIRQQCPIDIFTPRMLHANSGISAEQSYLWLAGKYLPQIRPKSLLVGVGLSGLLVARLQERLPELGLSVIAVNAPTEDEEIAVESKPAGRIAAYSSQYRPILGRCDWTPLAEAADVLWLQHGAYLHKYALRNAIVTHLKGGNTVEYLNGVLPTRE